MVVAFQSLAVSTQPDFEPIDLDEAKNHLKIDEDVVEDDDLIEALIVAARQHCEDVLRRALMTQTIVLKLDGFQAGGCIELPRPPLQSVTSIGYTLEDGPAATVDGADYVVDAASEPARILLQSLSSWPSDALQPGASVAITFIAGYGDDGEDVPRPIRTAMLLLLAHWYRNREAVIDTGRQELLPVPMAVDSLLMPYRFWGSY